MRVSSTPVGENRFTPINDRTDKVGRVKLLSPRLRLDGAKNKKRGWVKQRCEEEARKEQNTRYQRR